MRLQVADRYDIVSDKDVPIAQDWVENLNRLAELRAADTAAVCYHAQVDGWVAIAQKFIRNAKHENIIWMQRKTWNELANCANRDGLFYIPSTAEIATNQKLREIVNQMESPDGEAMASG